MGMPLLRGNFSRSLDADPMRGTYRSGRNYAASRDELLSSIADFTRATVARDSDAFGALVESAVNTLRNGYDVARIAAADWRLPTPNGVRNPLGTGTGGNPAGAPDNWDFPTALGLTGTIIGKGVENGMSYVDVRYAGTGNATSSFRATFDSGSGLPTVAGQAAVASAYVKLVGGTAPSASTLAIEVYECDNAGTRLFTTAVTFTASGAWQRVSAARTFVSAQATQARSSLRIVTTSGTARDFTLRFAFPIVERGSVPSDVTPLPHGWLIENTATNQVVDSAAGISGSGATGNTNVVSTDVPPPFTGATVRKHTRAADTTLNADDNGGIIGFTYTALPAASTASHSVYVYVPSSSSFPGTNPFMRIEGGGTTSLAAVNIDLTKRDQWQRVTIPFTVPTWTSQPFYIVRMGATNANAVIYTAAPQIEASPVATSYIHTTGVAAARSPDQLAISGANLAALLGTAQSGTIIVDAYMESQLSNNARFIAQLDDGTNSNRIQLRTNLAGTNIIGLVTNAGVQAGASALASPPTYGTPFRIGLRWDVVGSRIGVSLNGAAIGTWSGAMPAAFSTLRIGANAGGSEATTGRIRRVQAFPFFMADDEFRARTALGAG